MARLAAKVSQIEFANLWNAACAAAEEDPRNPGSWLEDIGKIGKDISKVHFDFENCSWRQVVENHMSVMAPCVFCTPEGLVYIEAIAGGDWECPVNFIIYLDQNGKTFR